jgi:hypothetical protein
MIASVVYTPFLILTTFYLYHSVVRAALYVKNDGRFPPVLDDLFNAPAKIATSGFMVMEGIPTENQFSPFLWIGIAMLFLYSGCKGFYMLTRSGGNVLEVVTPIVVVSAKEQKKATRLEENLRSDLQAFLDDFDSTGSTETK